MTDLLQAAPIAYTIQEAAKRTGLSEHTLRYYERAGLITLVHRDDSSRHRRYSDDNLRLIEFLKRMRATGMPISRIQTYVALLSEGEETLEKRRRMLEEHRESVRAQIAELHAHLEAIDYKIANYLYQEAASNNAHDRCLEISKGKTDESD